MTTLINFLILILIAWIIGTQRSNSGKAIGFRSLALVMIGAYAFTTLSIKDGVVVDYHVIAQIVTGISFVGAGLIFKDNGVHNLTTAILVWTMAAIAVTLGLGLTLEAIIFSLTVWLILCYKKEIKWKT